MNTTKRNVRSVYAGLFGKQKQATRRQKSTNQFMHRKSFMKSEVKLDKKESSEFIKRQFTIDRPLLYNPVLRSQNTVANMSNNLWKS